MSDECVRTPEQWAARAADDAKYPALPLRDKPCDDCAVTDGFYEPFTRSLAEQPLDVQEVCSSRWWCHNDARVACRGNANLLATLRRRKDADHAE